MSIYGNAVGGITGYGKTFILQDENGNEVVGTVVDDLMVFDADPSTDIRAGKKAVTDAGVVVGSTTIPNYETSQGKCLIMPGETLKVFNLSPGLYDYTFLQCIVTLYNTNVSDSVYAEYVAIDDSVYETKSTTRISLVTKDSKTEDINLNITNDSDNIYIVRFTTYKEVV